MRSSVEEERELRVVRPGKDRGALLKPAVTRESLVGARNEVDLARLKPSKTWRTQIRGIIGWNTLKAGPNHEGGRCQMCNGTGANECAVTVEGKGACEKCFKGTPPGGPGMKRTMKLPVYRGVPDVLVFLYTGRVPDVLGKFPVQSRVG